jgi:hypothetical protein
MAAPDERSVYLGGDESLSDGETVHPYMRLFEQSLYALG